MSCASCKSNKILGVSAKCSDLCTVTFDGNSLDGYVPSDLGIGGGDYVEFDLCLSCGKIQDSFPKEPSSFEETEEEYP